MNIIKSITAPSVITILAAFALVGCNQNAPSGSTDTPATNTSMSADSGRMGGTTNLPAINSVPVLNTNLPATNNLPDGNTNLPAATNS